MPQRSTRNFHFVILALALLLAGGCSNSGDDGSDTAPGASPSSDTSAQQAGPPFSKDGTLAFVRQGDTLSTLDIEVAETPEKRHHGLMQRLSLPVGSGMLFIFPEDDVRVRGFWMKNTPMSLDILFASADSQIVRVAKRTTPYSTDQVSSEVPSRFVVEVPAGYASRKGIIAGDRIRFRKSGAATSPLQRSAGSTHADSRTAKAPGR